MNIHEHQAKAVLKEFGVPVPRAFAAFTVDEAVKLLSENGNLVKRPFLVTGGGGLVGFDETEWLALIR